MRRGLFFLIWVSFILYAWLFAPTGNAGYLNQLLTMDNPDPLLLCVFSMLGIFPMAFSMMLLSHDRQRIPAWPFAIGSFALGAFALLPYFFLTKNEAVRSVRTPRWLLSVFQSLSLRLLLLIGTMVLVVYGFGWGSIEQYVPAFQASSFVHVMTIDLFVLSGLSVYAIYCYEQQRRYLAWLGVIPLIGFLLYLVIEREEKNEVEKADTKGSGGNS